MRVATLIFFVLVMCGNILAGELTMLKNGVQFITEKRDYTRTLSVTVMIKGGMFKRKFSKQWDRGAFLVMCG